MFSRRVCAAGAASLAAWLAIQTPASALPQPQAHRNSVDPIAMQVQEKSQWCWVASGNTIAAHHGVTVGQNEFCRIAHGERRRDCADRPGTLGDVRRAFGKLGFSAPGNHVKGRIAFSAVQAQAGSGRPVQTRVGWASGGGHMHVLYGSDIGDAGRKWVSWGDPLPTGNRYNWSTYDFYAGNRSFTWTDTLTGIRR
ncbi:papain-like cysteine protease family protein [Amycolatopsis pittospori]|uniref:papain-like cysteine protease family protein n=1 Tax=Amycolatopsis pittospori TaxID=2749434 RepID=UPI0015F0B3E1|nr:papain-like cysteine protease family protein [Amycolatopsis pittospori]